MWQNEVLFSLLRVKGSDRVDGHSRFQIAFILKLIKININYLDFETSKQHYARLITTCQICKLNDLKSVIFLGYLPPVNSMPSILDVAATLERLETYAIGVVGYKTKRFPGFYLTDSGFELEYQVDTPADIAEIMKARYNMGTQCNSLIVANPVVNQMDKVVHDRLLDGGLKAAAANNIHGKETTPFLLEYFHTESKGESLRVNIEIIKGNSALAAQIAAAL